MFMVGKSACPDGNRYCGANWKVGGNNTPRESGWKLERKGPKKCEDAVKVISRDRQGNGRTVGRVNMIMLLVGLTIGAMIGFGVAALLRGGE